MITPKYNCRKIIVQGFDFKLESEKVDRGVDITITSYYDHYNQDVISHLHVETLDELKFRENDIVSDINDWIENNKTDVDEIQAYLSNIRY